MLLSSESEQINIIVYDNIFSSLNKPVFGEIKIPVCQICHNIILHYDTNEKPACSAYGMIPEKYLYCKTSDCPEFIPRNHQG